MKKNGEFVGVDEKFIPEDEKYVDESLLGKDEKAKSTTKKVFMGIGIGYLVFAVIGLIIFFVIFSFVLKIFNNANSIMNGTNENVNSMMNNFGDKANGLYNKFEEDREQHRNENDKEAEKLDNKFFNSKFEIYSGTNSKTRLTSLLDSIALNNKKNKDKIISITYNNNEINKEEDIIKLKYDLEEDKTYEVTVDYNDNMLINKITIYNVK